MKQEIQNMRRNLNVSEELHETDDIQEIITHITEIRNIAQEIINREAYIKNNKVDRDQYLEFLKNR